MGNPALHDPAFKKKEAKLDTEIDPATSTKEQFSN